MPARKKFFSGTPQTKSAPKKTVALRIQQKPTEEAERRRRPIQNERGGVRTNCANELYPRMHTDGQSTLRDSGNYLCPSVAAIRFAVAPCSTPPHNHSSRLLPKECLVRMAGALCHLCHMPFLCRNRIAPFPATRGAAICNHMNRNLEDLIPILLLPGCERELCATLHALVMLVHIPQGRTVGTMRGVLRHIRLDRAFRHLFDTIIVIRLVNGRRPAWFGLFGASHQEFAEYRL